MSVVYSSMPCRTYLFLVVVSWCLGEAFIRYSAGMTGKTHGQCRHCRQNQTWMTFGTLRLWVAAASKVAIPGSQLKLLVLKVLQTVLQAFESCCSLDIHVDKFLRLFSPSFSTGTVFATLDPDEPMPKNAVTVCLVIVSIHRFRSNH